MWTQRHLRGEKLRCNFLARKVQHSSPISAFWRMARKSANFFVRVSTTKVHDVTSVSLSLSLYLSLSLSLSLSVSLSLSLSLSLTSRTHNIGRASALPIIPDWITSKQLQGTNSKSKTWVMICALKSVGTFQSMRTVGKMWLNLDIWVLQGRGCGRARRKIAMAASFRGRTSERSHSQGKLLSCVPMCGLG